MALLALTWGIGYINLGPFNLIVALAIAITKGMLVVLFFMHIKGSSRLLHLAAAAGVLWLLIMLAPHPQRLHQLEAGSVEMICVRFAEGLRNSGISGT